MSGRSYTFYYYDGGVYRENRETGHTELHFSPGHLYREPGWGVVVPSEQDYDHLRRITRAEAARRLGDVLDAPTVEESPSGRERPAKEG